MKINYQSIQSMLPRPSLFRLPPIGKSRRLRNLVSWSTEQVRQPSSWASFALALLFTYGGTRWLSVLQQFGGGNSSVATPFVSSYFGIATLALPVVSIVTWLGLRLIAQSNERNRFNPSASLITIVTAATLALLASVVLGATSLIGSQQPWLLQWLNQSVLLLVAMLPIALVACTLLGATLWQREATLRFNDPLNGSALNGRIWQMTARMLMIAGLVTPPLAASTQSAQAAGVCPATAPIKTFNVSAIDVNMWLDRFGTHDPNAQMYVLTALNGQATPGIAAVRAQEAAGRTSLSIGLRDDAIQPLAIRANQGDCVVINFKNETTRPAPTGGTPGVTTNVYGMHIDGVAFQISSSGDNIGNNGQSAVAQGGTIQYTYFVPNDPTLEGAHYIHPGPGNRQAVAHGLFGTLNVEPPGSVYLNPTTGQPQPSGWEAVIVPGTGKAFRENVKVLHEIGNDHEFSSVPVDINGNGLPNNDPHTGAYRPGARAINYRSESFMVRLDFGEDQKSTVYGSYTFGDTSNIIPRGYLGDPTKFRLVHGGSEVFHVYHLHGGSIRWRFNPKADPTFDYAKTGLDKHPVEIQSQSARLDAQAQGPGESNDLEIENGAGGAQQGAGEFLFHCHIAHHYFAGMWGYWRVYDTLQPDLMPLPDRSALPQPVTSAGLIGKSFFGQAVTAANLDAWIRQQLPTQGVTRVINAATRDDADQDASVWDWKVDTSTGQPLYLGEPDRAFTIPSGPLTGQPWPNFENIVPGHPSALIVDQTVQSTYLRNGARITFNAGGYIGNRPKILFNPSNGRPAWPMLRPHIAKRPPFSPNGHTGAPYLGETGGQPANPILPVGTTSTAPADPWANRPDGICPTGAPVRPFNVVGIPVPIQVTAPNKSNLVDPNGALDVLAQDKDAIYAGSKVYAGVQSREPLAIRANIGDCVAVTYVSELKDGNPELPFSKTNIHIHHVQFDTQASDGVISGFSYEQSIRPYKIVDPKLTAPLAVGDTVLHLASVAKFQPGVWIAIGMGTEGIEIRQIVSINAAALTVTLTKSVSNAHPTGEWAGTEFVQYRWYPDVELDNIFFHDHVNGIHGWSHGMVGQLVIEPVGSTYHDPVTGSPIKAGAIADIHTNPACVPGPDPAGMPVGTGNQCALIPGVVKGSFREFALWTINDHEPSAAEATFNLRAERWSDRSNDPAVRFSSATPAGDPFTPIPRAYVGDDVVIRNINVGQGTNTLTIDGHRTFWEPRFRDALGTTITASPVDTLHTGVSERYTLVLDGGAGGPRHVPGDYIYHDGENRRFQDGAWGILRVLPSLVSTLKPLPGFTIPAQVATCPATAPIHNFAISAVDLPLSTSKAGLKMAFVPSVQATAVISGTLVPEPLVMHVAQGECIKVAFTNRRVAAKASFHVGALWRNLASAGINIGNNADTMVAPGATRTYTFYANTRKIESVLITDFGGDNTGRDGLYGVIDVAPLGATYSNPTTGAATDIGSQVDVHVPGTIGYRDFTVILADQDPIIGQSGMPYPANVSGPSLVNYQQVTNRVDNANTFSSVANALPTTPLLRAQAGDPVKVHVLGAPGSEQVHVFSLGGMSWPSDMYITKASQFQNRGIGPWEKMDINIVGGAGGFARVAGDYFYGDIRRPFTQIGQWGIFRVFAAGAGNIRPLTTLAAEVPAEQPDDAPLEVVMSNSLYLPMITAPDITAPDATEQVDASHLDTIEIEVNYDDLYENTHFADVNTPDVNDENVPLDDGSEEVVGQ